MNIVLNRVQNHRPLHFQGSRKAADCKNEVGNSVRNLDYNFEFLWCPIVKIILKCCSVILVTPKPYSIHNNFLPNWGATISVTAIFSNTHPYPHSHKHMHFYTLSLSHTSHSFSIL